MSYRLFLYYILLCFFLFLTSCTSYEKFHHITQEFELPNKVFNATYDQTWKAVIDYMKRFDLELQNQEAGIIKTRWIDNTTELNFADSFDGQDTIKSARQKIIINIVKGFKGSKEVTKVSIYKKQMVEQDFLQGQKVIPSDGILEKTILYRIEQALKIDNRLKKIDEERAKKIEQSF